MDDGFSCKSPLGPGLQTAISDDLITADPPGHAGRFFLDIFSGASMPVSKAMADLSADRFEPLDIIHGYDLLDDDIFHDAMQLASSGLVAAAIAAPYCCHHSMAKLRKPGPPALRTPEHLDGVPSNSWEQQLAVQESALIHDRARHLLSAVARVGGTVILENPPSSMTWLDATMAAWVRQVTPFLAQAFACQFDRDWQKAWMFVSNSAKIEQVARSCNHPAGSHQKIAGARLPDGSYLSRVTAEYPAQLAAALAQVLKPFTSDLGRFVKLSTWRSLLPVKLEWPIRPGRVEDGGGLTSTALVSIPPQDDPLGQLRKLWVSRLCDTKQCLKISAHLATGIDAPPLSDTELQPYVKDLFSCFPDIASLPNIMDIPSGQPFRLFLWHALAKTWKDPDLDFLKLLETGVPLGVNQSLQPAPCWPHQSGEVLDGVPLEECESSWKSALDHPEIVQTLISEEVNNGFIAKIEGGLQELKNRYQQTAVGKLGLVLAEGRAPRLVVDSSISMVTSNTAIPNRMLLPKVSDLMQCAPVKPSSQQVTQLTLDVSKAHRRILIQPQDRGLLCFHAGQHLYQSITLNFGARASGWYWGRLAGHMVRIVHHMLPPTHCLFQYVDDMLLWLDKTTAPIWSSLVTILLLVLGVPMSWKKAQLDSQVVWIGWSICTLTWSITIPSDKLLRISDQIRALLKSSKATLKNLQSVVGRLLWITSAWRFLRPLLIPLYKDLSSVPLTMVGVDPVHFQEMVQALSDDLILQRDLLSHHHSLRKGTKLVRVANQFVTDRDAISLLYLKSRRIWLGIQDPTNPQRLLSGDSTAVLGNWLEILGSTHCSFSMLPPARISLTALADAMADEHMAGLGGVVYMDGGMVRWFRLTITREWAASHWPWVSDSMQKHIACWELLAQYALTFIIDLALPCSRGPVQPMQGTDNSATEATFSKGLSMNAAMASILVPYFKFMCRRCIYPEITHVPGHLNDVADGLSRGRDHDALGLRACDELCIPLHSLVACDALTVFQPHERWAASLIPAR